MQWIFQVKRRRYALLLSLMLGLMLLISIGVMFMEVGHACGGFDCAVCAGILSLRAMLTHLSVLTAVSLLLGWLGKLPRPAPFAGFAYRAQSTPVSLATRMND